MSYAPNVQRCHEKLAKLDMDWLREHLAYDESSPSGLRWLKSRGSRAPAGAAAGRRHRDGSWQVQTQGVLYMAHHLVLLLHGRRPGFGEEVDHIDRDRSNNRIENLRWVRRHVNLRNKSNNQKRQTPYRFVCWRRRERKWQAKWRHAGRMRHVGYFTDDYAAHLAAAADRNAELGIDEPPMERAESPTAKYPAAIEAAAA